MPDGKFESLNANNAIVFRVVFYSGALTLFTLAALTFLRRWDSIWNFLKQFWVDACIFLRPLWPARQEWLSLLALIMAMGLAVVLRLEYIFSSLHHDEAYTYMAFAHSLRVAITDYHLPNNHVFHSILVYLSTQIIGGQPWAVRLPAFIAGISLVPAVYVLGKRLYDRWVGLGAVLLVTMSPALIGYSTNARGYSLVAFFSLLIFTLGDKVREERNLFAWGLISIFSALGFYTVPVMMFPFGILFVWLFLENQLSIPKAYRSKWNFLLHWFISGTAAAILTLLLYLPVMIYSGPQKLFANEFVAPAAWEDLFNVYSSRLGRTWSEWTNRVPGILILSLVIGLFLGLVFHKRLSSRRVPLQLAALLWIIFLLIVQRPQAGSKVWVFLLPLALLWASAGIFGLLGLMKLKSIPFSALAVGLVFIAVLGRAALLLPQLPELWSVRGDEENAVSFVESQLQADDKLVVAPPDDAPVWYYAELHGIYAALYMPESDFARLFVLVNPDEGQTPASVLEARGPGQESATSCNLLEIFGKIQVFDCQESP
ncbi:MAG: glycosyltransferase family 39 protein [Chloroflexota bacterium]